MNKKNGFTLVELLAVIVILAVILVIAVPSIMSTITESKKGALESSAKLIASSVENAMIANQALGISEEISCEDVSNYNSEDYTCDLEFVDGNAEVTLIGKGKFDGMCVLFGTKERSVARMGNECPLEPVSFNNDSWVTIIVAVKVGDTSKYRVGDTKTVNLGSLGTHTVRIANKSACPTGANALESQTACGFVIEFADIITTYNMNPSGEYNGTTYQYGWNKDGWPGSQMYDYINVVTEKEGSGTIYNALPTELKDKIIKTVVVSSLGSEDKNRTEGNFVSEDKLYLLSPEEVYGTSFTSSSDTSRGTSRQLDYYATYKNTDGTIGVTKSKYAGAIKKNSSNTSENWRLRSAVSTNHYAFFFVGSDGYLFGNPFAEARLGVSPAFRLG